MVAEIVAEVERSAVFTPEHVEGPNAVDLSRALRAVLIAAGKDGTLPTLTCVRVELPAGGGVRFAATDRFRLHVVGVGCDPMPDDAAPYALIPATALKPYVQAWKPATVKVSTVTLRQVGRGLEIVTDSVDGTTSTILAGYEGEYPKAGMLLRDHSKDEGAGEVSGFNPKYLSDVLDAAGFCVERDEPVRVTVRGSKPARVETDPTCQVRFTGIVMPKRASWIG